MICATTLIKVPNDLPLYEEAYKIGPLHTKGIKEVVCGTPDPRGEQIVSNLMRDTKVIHTY